LLLSSWKKTSVVEKPGSRLQSKSTFQPLSKRDYLRASKSSNQSKRSFTGLLPNKEASEPAVSLKMAMPFDGEGDEPWFWFVLGF
jgi:hypothetical protein